MTLLLCAALPLVAAAMVSIIPDRYGRPGLAAIAIVAHALAFGAALAIAQAIAAGRPSVLAEIGPWLPVRGGDLTLFIGAGTVPLLLVATAVPAGIAIVSWRIPKTPSDHAALLIGTSAAVVLVTAANLVLMVGALAVMSAATYLTFSGRRGSPTAAAGAERVFVIDRIGDAAMLLASIAYLAIFRSVGVVDIEARVTSAQADAALIVPSALLVTSVLAKSGLVPFHLKSGSLRATSAPLAAFGGSVAVGAGAVVLIRLSAFVHPAVLAAGAALGALSAVIVLIVAATRRDLHDALAWSASAPVGIAVAAVAAGAANVAVATLAAAGAAAAVVALLAAAGRRAPRWTGIGSSAMRRAVVDGLAFAALAATIGRAYGALTRTLERGTDVALDELLRSIVALTVRMSRALAREERRAVRVEAVAIAGLIAIVAFWIAR